MSRRTRKQIVGKVENAKIAQNLRELRVLERLLGHEWWSQRRGQIRASEVLPHVQREREQAR